MNSLSSLIKCMVVAICMSLINDLSARDKPDGNHIRQPVDTVGFALHAWQMDSVMKRLRRMTKDLEEAPAGNTAAYRRAALKAAICPHDDYAYAGWLYPDVLKNIRASTVILFGVAHKAKKFGIEERLVFDSFGEWKEPYGNIPVPGLREEIMKTLPGDAYIVHDSLQQAEHSVEAIIPFLQYYNRPVRIISILVPYMSFDRMDLLSGQLASGLNGILKEKELQWGKDVAFVISTDAVHYGDEEWGGYNYAPYGCDEKGYEASKKHESEIIRECLVGRMETEKGRRFTQYTVKEDDYKSYKWTWCGRYSVPFGLLTVIKLQALQGKSALEGEYIGYGTSLNEPKLKVEDIGMGTTAIATMHHWVGYAGVVYY